MRRYDDEQRSQVERIVGQDLDEQTGKGKPLSSRAAQTRRSIDAYLKSGSARAHHGGGGAGKCSSTHSGPSTGRR